MPGKEFMQIHTMYSPVACPRAVGEKNSSLALVIKERSQK